MSTLISNLNTIESCKLDIKSAIEAKGVDMTSVSFPDYASAIGSIPTGGTGFTEADITEKNYSMTYLSNSASFVADYAFYSNSYLQSIYLPNCIEIKEAAFFGCTSLVSISLPNCNILNNNAFGYCTALVSINIPCTIIRGFTQCNHLTTVVLPNCTNIDPYTFNGCTVLSELTLGASVVCSVSGNSFNNTALRNGNGFIYVPYSLISDYLNSIWGLMFSSEQFLSIPE